VPIAASATFTLPGGGGVINGRVDIVLPKDLVLPVQLNMIVPVDTDIPVNLPVAVAIPLNETQLHTPFQNLRDLLEPYVRVLDNLPDNWGDVPDFLIDAIQGEGVNLVSPTEDSQHPWPGPEAYHPLGPKTDTGAPHGETPVETGEMGAETGAELSAPVPTATPVEDIGIIPPTSSPP
jgi:hypothetical protein